MPMTPFNRLVGRLAGVVMLSTLAILGTRSVSWGQDDAWTYRTAMPTARTAPGGCVLDGQIYVTGGAVNGSALTAAVEVYDPASDTWTQRASLPSPLTCHATCSYDGKIFVFGGISPTVQSAATKRVYVYDPQADTWTRKADMLYPIAWCGIAAVNGTIYLFGGCTAVPSSPSRRSMAYDPATDTWTQAADLPTPRFACSACVVGGQVYVIGGCNGSWQSYKRVEVYDPSANTWTREAEMPTQRLALATCVAYGRIYAMGGVSYYGTCNPPPVGATANERYDPDTDTWTRKSLLRQERLGLLAGRVGNTIYAIGGSYPCPQPTMFSTVEAYGLVPEIALGAVRADNAKLELHWQIAGPPPGSGLVLQRADAPEGPWTDLIPDPQSPVEIERTEPMKLYRIRTAWPASESEPAP